MQLFRNLPVARKFLCAFGLVGLLCAVLGAIALAGMAKINRSTDNLSRIAIPSAQAINNMGSAMQILRRASGLHRLALLLSPQFGLISRAA